MKTILLFLLLSLTAQAQLVYNWDPRNFKLLPPGTEVFSDFLTNTRKPGIVPKSIEISNQMVLDSAHKYGLKVWLSASAEYPGNVEKYDKDPVVIGYSTFDEISGEITLKGWHSLVALRKLTTKEILVTCNNFLQLWQVGMVCTRVGPDPYITPKVSHRQVALATSEARKTGKKVTTILNNYSEGTDTRLPDYADLRAQVFAAICNGADNVGFFSGDTRRYNKETKQLEGWQLSQDPDRLNWTIMLLKEIGKYKGTSFRSIPTGFKGVSACYRGNTLIVCNTDRVERLVMIEGRPVRLSSLGLEIW